ncbi:MAG TPA: DNA translocase FtsK [Patescibacteria group bacterium]|nr:DNA translocase FtsK [Patescibacteria group bacterium]
MTKSKSTATPKKKRGEIKQEAEKKQEIKKYSWDAQGEDVQQGLLVIILFACAAISFLSFIHAASDVGIWVNSILGHIFGWGRYVIPAVLAVLGYVFLHPETYRIRMVNYLGLALFLLSGLALLYLTIPISQMSEAISAGQGGGYFGLLFFYPLMRFAGIWVTIVVLLGIFIASWLIMFNTSLKTLFEHIQQIRWVVRPLQWIRSRVHARIHGYAIDTKKEEQNDLEETEQHTANEQEDEASQLFSQKEIASSGAKSYPATEKDLKQMELIPKEPTRKRHRKIDLPIDLLSNRNEKPTSGDIELNKIKIQETLHNFGIEVEMGDVSVGPMVSQYTLKPSQGVKLTQITSLHNDIALALAAHPIRIEAPIPGQSLVGIEVPNKAAATVTLREILTSKQFKQRKDQLALCLGKDVSGKSYTASIASMPHLLIAGATGSGKSVCINGIILSLLYQNSPDDLRFIMIDPKRVELSVYNGIPHLLTPVITDIDKTINSLKWTVAEMDRRYELLSRAGKRNIASFNAIVEEDEKMPYIVFVIDELADLMSVAANSVEAAIVRLAQMSRAVGIHLILATQRPSVNVITGLIKANMPARIAFSVTSLVDSRTILDFSGAEKLLGRGDMLYIDAKISKPKRLQGALVTDDEIERIVAHLTASGDPDYNTDVTDKSVKVSIPGLTNMGGGTEEASDDLLEEAKKIIVQAGKASASLLQRRLRIGYARAARILDILEEQGFIGPAEGAKPREILINNEDGMEIQEEQAIEIREQQEEKVNEEFSQEKSSQPTSESEKNHV